MSQTDKNEAIRLSYAYKEIYFFRHTKCNPCFEFLIIISQHADDAQLLRNNPTSHKRWGHGLREFLLLAQHWSIGFYLFGNFLLIVARTLTWRMHEIQKISGFSWLRINKKFLYFLINNTFIVLPNFTLLNRIHVRSFWALKISRELKIIWKRSDDSKSGDWVNSCCDSEANVLWNIRKKKQFRLLNNFKQMSFWWFKVLNIKIFR